jgi:hypothetical protein
LMFSPTVCICSELVLQTLALLLLPWQVEFNGFCFQQPACAGPGSENKKASTTVLLGFETWTIFMSCLLLRHKAAWLQFQNFSIACFVWTMSFQRPVPRRTDMAIHNASRRRKH